MTEIVLELDEIDYRAVMGSIAEREALMPLPDGKENINGRAIAEICRGWFQMLHSDAPDDKADWWKE